MLFGELWGSEWCIQGLCLGSSSTPFIRRFRPGQLYRQVDLHEVVSAFEQIQELGEPMCTSDKEACEETIRVLNFCKKWLETECGGGNAG